MSIVEGFFFLVYSFHFLSIQKEMAAQVFSLSTTNDVATPSFFSAVFSFVQGRRNLHKMLYGRLTNRAVKIIIKEKKKISSSSSSSSF